MNYTGVQSAIFYCRRHAAYKIWITRHKITTGPEEAGLGFIDLFLVSWDECLEGWDR